MTRDEIVEQRRHELVLHIIRSVQMTNSRPHDNYVDRVVAKAFELAKKHYP